MSLSIASREPTFRVATIEDADVVIDRLVYSLTTVEPVSASLQLDHHDVRTFYEDYIPDALAQGFSLIATSGDECVGVMIITLKHRGDPFYSHEDKRQVGDGLRRLNLLLDELNKDFWKEMPPAFHRIIHTTDVWVDTKKNEFRVPRFIKRHFRPALLTIQSESNPFEKTTGLFRAFVYQMYQIARDTNSDAIVTELLNSNTKTLFSIGFVRFRVVDHSTFRDDNNQRIINCPTENSSCLGVVFMNSTLHNAKL